MATLLSTYRTFKNFPKTEPIDFINIPIQIGTGDGELKLKPEYARYIGVDYKPWLVIEEFRRIEPEILHPELDPEIWKLHKKTLAEIWEKRTIENRTLWSRNIDGRHIEPEQIWYTKNNEKRIIPAREILDDNYGKNKKGNDTIENIRDKFLRRYKTGRGNYENTGNYYYKSRYHKELFLEIIQALGLVKKAEPKKSTVEIKALDPTSQKDIVETNNYFYNEETGDYEILREDEL